MNPPRIEQGPEPVHYRPRRRAGIDLIVLHSMESQEKPGTAKNVAAWIADPRRAPEASFHYAVDDQMIVQCVPTESEAWHAPGVNARSIGIEHAGRASQTSEQWADPYSSAVLGLSAQLVSYLCWAYRIPTTFVTASDLKRGAAGITTHAEVSKAFRLSTHWDPGPGFPLAGYLLRVERLLAAA